MLELSALLGAMVISHVFLSENVRQGDEASYLHNVLIAPAMGALWGLAIGAVIKFTANGVFLGFAMSFLAFALPSVFD